MQYIQRSILLLICLTVSFASFVGAQEKQASDLFKIKVNNKYGFIDKLGNIVIEPQFQGVYDFSDGLAKIYTSGEFNTAYINETGKVVIEPKFDIGGNFSEGFAWVGFDPEKKPYKIGNLTLYSSQGTHSFNYKIGFIDKTGKFITEPIFTFAGDFSEGLAFVRTKENKFGFIDKTGKFAIEPKFDWADVFSEGLALVFINGKYGFIDKTGKIVIKPQFTKAESFSEGLAVVKIGGAVREPNLGSQIVTTTIADMNYAYINKTGKIVFRIKAHDARSFSEGFARFERNGNWGFIDKTGKIVFEPQINAVGDFLEGLALVFLEGENYSFGFIDKNGNPVIKTNYSLVGDFKNGLAEIEERNPKYSTDIVNAKYGYIDKTGKVIWQPTK